MVNDEDVIKKVRETKSIGNKRSLINIRRRLQFKLQNNKQPAEEILFQRSVKTTIQIHYAKGLFDDFPNADGVLKDFSFVTRRNLFENLHLLPSSRKPEKSY